MRIAALPTNKNEYDEVLAYEWNDNIPWEEVNHEVFKARKKKGPKFYNEAFATFDIETTTIVPDYFLPGAKDNYESPWGFMYHWQMCIDGICIYGRYWGEWIQFINKMISELHINSDSKFIIYVHNLSFEFQWMQAFLMREYGSVDVFASAPRKPMKVNIPCGIEFRCSYFLSNMSLFKATTTELGVKHIKAAGDLDYKITRTPETELDDVEFAYCISDVLSLWEYIKCKLKNEGDNLESIPLTSTGYVRRDCRTSCINSKKYMVKFRKLQMNLLIYQLLKEAGRGGNTHTCRWMANRIWHDVFSFDVASSYPAQILLRRFPMTKFFEYGIVDSIEELHELFEKYACLFRVTFTNIRLKKRIPMPYLPISKAMYYPEGLRSDNGRVLEASTYIGTFTDIDFKIIEDQYDWDDIYITSVYVSRYDYLPEELTSRVLYFFREKSQLKEDIKNAKTNEERENLEYLYAKSKNRLNGIFGMMYTDPCNSEVEVEDGEWKENPVDIEEALAKFYNSRNSFLFYAWGVWTTAWARKHLEDLINATSNRFSDQEAGEGSECIYCDTDSSKCINPDLTKIEALNNSIIQMCEERGAYADVNGHRYYMGIYENETDKHTYRSFKALGAKKYCYESLDRNDDGTEEWKLHITVSGVGKKAAKQLNSINDFNVGFQFTEYCGSTLYYNDDTTIKNITVAGCTFETSSNIGLIDSTYKLGITEEYSYLLQSYCNY